MYSFKGEFPKSDFYDKTAIGIVNVFTTRDIDLHRRYRRLLSQGISESSLNTHVPAVDSQVRLAMQRMGEEMQRRGATDVFNWFLCMATDIIGELSFGESFRMLETGEAVAKLNGLRTTFPFLVKLSYYVPIPFISEAVNNRKRLLQYSETSLGRHYRIVEEEGEDAKPTLLSKLYKAGEDGLSFKEIRANAQSYIANTLTYLVYNVCKHPEVKTKLVDELQGLPDDFDYNDVKSLPYLNQVIEETLRLYSSVPGGLPRMVTKEGAEFNGHFIPGGYTVSVQPYSMHRNPDVFPEPMEYNPSRWENPTKAMKDSFLPFGGGSRVCIGLHLARMELRLATARFFATFPYAEVSSAEGFKEADMEPAMFFLLSPKSHRCLINAA
ncbi:hypothetical protein JX265_005886 [Neoarthrinium moseri]|uniref:Cytochrome P450 n=1 Tax=Neoarthrinium moseri TaxID=1658444 RepID=A0A9P9WNB1_9PEZI|nr:hypothetical protein JX265_005886 [Neoarthrinium moseri]